MEFIEGFISVFNSKILGEIAALLLIAVAIATGIISAAFYLAKKENEQ